MRAKPALPLLLGGMEREYALIYPPPAEEHGEFAWWLMDCLAYDLERVLSARGGWVRYLVSTRSGLAKYVLHDGGCLAIEDLNVLEVSTPEAYDALACLAYLDEYGGLLSRVVGACSEAPEGSIMTEGPAELPRFEPGEERRFALAFHLNYSAELTREQGLEFCTVLAALMPLLGCGGLTLRGFSCSPRGFMVRRPICEDGTTFLNDDMVRLYGTEAVASGGPEIVRGSRLHVSCLDSPLTRRTAAFLFEACRFLVTLILYGRGPLGGRRLARPERACAAIAGDEHHRRFGLRGGGTTDLRGLHEAMRRGLERALTECSLKPAQERVLEALILGLRAFRRGDEEELSLHFDGYLRKKIYRELLANEGVTLSFFNRVAVPVSWHASRLCSGLPELASFSPGEAEKLLRGRSADERSRRELASLLCAQRVSPREVPSLARLVQRVLTLEIRLHQLHPEPSPLVDYECELWSDCLEGMEPAPDAPPTRAEMRGKLVSALAYSQECSCRADWSGLYVLAPHEMVGAFSLPDPHRPQACFSWIEIPASEEHVMGGGLLTDLEANRYILYADVGANGVAAGGSLPHLPGGQTMLDALRFGVTPGQLPLWEDGEEAAVPRHLHGIPRGQLRLF